MITREQLISKYLRFFESKGHKIIPSASLIPENDPTVLFTTAGMHPLVPFLLGQKHPEGKRLCDVQKCIRTQDIDEVGDTVHHTFFEMLGNWSLGDYFKEKSIKFIFEFHNKILKIPVENYAVTIFSGNKNSPKDIESEKTWLSLGIPKERIAFTESDNWWGPAGSTGPCGPCTEMFYWTGKEKAPKKFDPENKNWVEIGNDVIMQYVKDEKGNYNLAKQKNIDFGGGVERTLAILNGFYDNYRTDCFLPIIKAIEKLSGKKYGADKEDTRTMRIIADHLKASVFIISDGAVPSNTEQGYVLRRLIRRAVRYGKFLEMEKFTKIIAEPIFDIYPDYERIQKNKKNILAELEKEEERFSKTIEQGLRYTEKVFSTKVPIQKERFLELMKSPNKGDLIGRAFENKKNKKDYSIKSPKISEKEIDSAQITGEESFLLYQSYGFPLEMIDELAMAKGLLLSHADFRSELQKHQELSRTASAGVFKSGLADNSEKTTKLHTATHLLLATLKEVLKNPNIEQRGSNINPERLRFDFSFDRKLTDEEIKKIEDLINAKIQMRCEVCREEMSPEEAKKSGATGIFDSKYGNKVSVYTINDPKTKKFISKEICTGPHVGNTCEIGKFKILKEEASSAGVRRIKGTVD